MIYAFGDVNLDCIWDFQETPSKRDVLFPELGTSNYRLGSGSSTRPDSYGWRCRSIAHPLP